MKKAEPFCRISSSVRLCWELEEPKGPKGSSTASPAAWRALPAEPPLRPPLQTPPARTCSASASARQFSRGRGCAPSCSRNQRVSRNRGCMATTLSLWGSCEGAQLALLRGLATCRAFLLLGQPAPKPGMGRGTEGMVTTMRPLVHGRGGNSAPRHPRQKACPPGQAGDGFSRTIRQAILSMFAGGC